MGVVTSLREENKVALSLEPSQRSCAKQQLYNNLKLSACCNYLRKDLVRTAICMIRNNSTTTDYISKQMGIS